MAMRNKALAGGAVGLVLVGAYYLSSLFNGFGLGPGGGGSGTGAGNDNAPAADINNVANYRSATLDQIVQMAKDVEGEQGLKVRIAMRDTSTAQAEADLQNALIEGGLSRTAFRELEDTIP
jgi:hypothetical protein